MKINKTIYLLTALTLMLGAGLWLTGCESDTVAPHDNLPELTPEDVAYQAGALATASGRFLPQLVEFSGTDKTEYTYTFPAQGSDVTGTVHFDFRLGGADGSSADFDAADWGHMYTGIDSPLSFAVGAGGNVELKFSILADIVQATQTATLLEGSAGTFVGGDYLAVFSFDGVVITAGEGYPSAGIITFISSGHVLVVTFDGDETATISLDDVPTWIVNLNSGVLVEVS